VPVIALGVDKVCTKIALMEVNVSKPKGKRVGSNGKVHRHRYDQKVVCNHGHVMRVFCKCGKVKP